jgi:elongation factor 4
VAHRPLSKTTTAIKEDTPRLVSILEDRHLLKDIPLEDVRNFCFIAHVDHGKSSLSSRILESKGNLGKDKQQFAWRMARGLATADDQEIIDTKETIGMLDSMAVEQERGITVKASSAALLYPHPSAVGPTGLLLVNMYDTPGHVDFGREVTRSLCFVQGAVLLLDATQGMQAQTWSVYEKAKSLPHPPHILLALTKVDLDSARPVNVALSACEWLQWDDPDTILLTSARNRIGIKEVLDRVCAEVPPPTPLADDDGTMLRAQVVDSWYDDRGVNCLVRILSGTLTENDRISIAKGPTSSNATLPQSASTTSYSVQEVGMLLPQACRTGHLLRGQMGTVRFGLRDPRQALPGTLLVSSKDVQKSMILPEIPADVANTHAVLYASVHPEEADGFEELCDAVERLALNDTGLEVSKTSSVGGGEGGGPFLGPGLRVGFQGLLHVEVFRQRLEDEFDISAVVTPPKVPYVVTYFPSKHNTLEEPVEKIVEDLREWPESGEKFRVKEPIVDVRIIARTEDAGAVMDLMQRKRGTNIQSHPMDLHCTHSVGRSCN